MARNYNILTKALISLSLVFWAVLSAHSQSIYKPIVVDLDTVGFVLKDDVASSMNQRETYRRALFADISESVRQRIEESNAGVEFEVATDELKAKAIASWEKQRRSDMKRELSMTERQRLLAIYVNMPNDENKTARALFNSGRYSQYAMTVNLAGGVLASLVALENPPVSLAITLLTAVTSIALNWKAGDELKKAGVYSRDQ
jgi:hypothetical protein